MSFIQEKEKSRAIEVASLVNQRIAKENLAPFPEIYELWFVYYIRSRADVVQTVDQLIDSKTKITDNVCLSIYQRLLSDLKNEETVRRAGEQMQSTLTDVSDIFKDVQHAANDYNESLTIVTTTLSNTNSPKEIEAALSTASEKTKSMIEHNQKLEAELQHSAVLMAELKRDLEFVRREAMTDGLTGLANRKAFDNEIEQMIHDAAATNKAFTLLMVDIDHFKSFNDNYGHQVGDQVLRLVARTLKESLKGRDFAARYGGEEFAILLPETGVQPGVAVGNFLRQAIASKDVINRVTGESLGRITMSVGVAEFAAGESIDDMVSRADGALYTAKHNGRNQVAAARTPGADV